MNSLLGLPETRQNESCALGPTGTVAGQVVSLLAAANPPGKLERRREQRFPYPQIVYLTVCPEQEAAASAVAPIVGDLLPVAAGASSADSVIAVVGKHLSRSGFGFFHKEPIPHRTMIASFEGPQKRWVAFLIDITWCRFNGHGWYDSGGRFLKVVPSPFERKE